MTKALLDKVSELKSKIDISATNTSDDHELRQLVTRSDQLAKIEGHVSKLFAFLTDTQKLSVKEIISNRDMSEIQALFSRFYQTYCENGRNIANMQERDVTEFTSKANQFLDRTQKNLLDDWKRFCDTKIPPVDTGSLDALKEFARLQGIDRTRIIRLNKTLEEFGRIKDDIPEVLENTLNKLDDVKNDYQEFLNNIDTGEIHPSILKFLKAVSSGNCTLLNVDAKVLSWLSERNLSKNYRIKTY